MNEDGSNQTNLTNNAAGDTQAAVSPDGKQIAFRTDRDGNGEIYVMNADTGDSQENLTKNPARDYQLHQESGLGFRGHLGPGRRASSLHEVGSRRGRHLQLRDLRDGPGGPKPDQPHQQRGDGNRSGLLS
jgi:hypothetical protein